MIARPRISLLDRLRRAASVAACLIAVAGTASVAGAARSVPLQPGENQGTADGFVGTQTWTVSGHPGPLEIRIMTGQMANNTFLGATFHVQLTILPHSQKKYFKFQEVQGGYLFTGHPTADTHLSLAVIPQTSTLVRNATTYTITTGGNFAFGTASGGDPIVGAYTGTTQGMGAVKFLPGGKLVTSNGDNGTWQLFDASTHLYVVTLGQNRYTVKNVPGQGLLDSMNGNIVFQAMH